MEPYLVPGPSSGEIYTEQVVKKSRFICNLGYADTAAAAKRGIEIIRNNHSQARHVCWAYIAGPPKSVSRGMSDDGEPRGTAGKPILSVLEHAGLGDVWVTVTRYYGGIKLGTGGLVRAYANSVQQTLELIDTITKEPTISVSITINYPQLASLEGILETEKATITDRIFAEHACIHALVPKQRKEKIFKQIGDASNGSALIKILWKP